MRSTPTLIELALLLLWLGGAVLFAAIVAPSLFATLPTRTLAGAVVGRVLPSIFYSGMLIGVLTLLLDWQARGEWKWRGGATGGLVMLIACGVAQLVISPRIERVRQSIGGVIENLAPDDPRRAEFGKLHAVSVGWLGVAMLCAAIVAVIAARSLHSAVAQERNSVPGISDL
jgi:MFS family permease